MFQELAKKFITECVNPELTLSERELNLIDSFAIYLQIHADQQPRALDAARRCPACKALLEEGSVYCDTCGTDTPRQ